MGLPQVFKLTKRFFFSALKGLRNYPGSDEALCDGEDALFREVKLLSYLLGAVVLVSCTPGDASRQGRAPVGERGGDAPSDVAGAVGKGTYAAGGGDQGSIISDINEKGEPSLRYIIDPDEGSVSDKVTIPKNYNGILYLGGLNIGSLRDRFIKVRFKFGRGLAPVTLPAVVARGEGLTPQSDIELLALDLSAKPFDRIRLRYDLFDYNDYRDETTGEESDGPVDDPKDGGLFCRGLDIAYDPTFEGSQSNPACDAVGETCLYAYAKIRDRGLVVVEDGRPVFSLTPREPQIGLSKEGYLMESGEDILAKCLPDNRDVFNINDLFNLNGQGGLGSLQDGAVFYRMRHKTTGKTVLSGSDSLLEYELDDGVDDSATYVYKGPFRALDTDSWQISGGAIFSEVSGSLKASGIFQGTIDSSNSNVQAGYRSFLFPRAAKMDIKAGVEHLSGSDPFGPRRLRSGGLHIAGQTDFMDGCNRRVHTYDAFSNENIASCNVTALIEIIYENEEGYEIALDSSYEIKLQLVRPSVKNQGGEEVLYTSLNVCSQNSNSCAEGECCFNNRCWSKSVVHQCLEDTPEVGRKGTGERCSGDTECASLCCRSSTSRCAVHLKTEDEEVLCSKAPGQSCLSKEMCRREYIPRCFKVRTGVTPFGVQLCAKRCYHVPTFGDCVNGRCVAPLPVDSHVDTSDCNDAIEPPSDLDNLPEAGGQEDSL